MNNAQTALPVKRQFDAYNAKDLAAFISCYHSDIAIYRMPATEPSLTGRAALEAFYKTERFTIAALRAEVLQRMVLGNKVNSEIMFKNSYAFNGISLCHQGSLHLPTGEILVMQNSIF